MTDNSATNIFCHTWDLLHKIIYSLLLNVNPIILAKPRLFYGVCFLQNTIKTAIKSVQKVTQNKCIKART